MVRQAHHLRIAGTRAPSLRPIPEIPEIHPPTRRRLARTHRALRAPGSDGALPSRAVGCRIYSEAVSHNSRKSAGGAELPPAENVTIHPEMLRQAHHLRLAETRAPSLRPIPEIHPPNVRGLPETHRVLRAPEATARFPPGRPVRPRAGGSTLTSIPIIPEIRSRASNAKLRNPSRNSAAGSLCCCAGSLQSGGSRATSGAHSRIGRHPVVALVRLAPPPATGFQPSGLPFGLPTPQSCCRPPPSPTLTRPPSYPSIRPCHYAARLRHWLAPRLRPARVTLPHVMINWLIKKVIGSKNARMVKSLCARSWSGSISSSASTRR